MVQDRIALLGVPYDAASSFQRGSAAAPPVIREALRNPAGNGWTESGIDLGEAPLDDAGDLRFTEGEPGDAARERIASAVDRIAGSGRKPLLLGGDHAVTYPILRGLRRHYRRLTVLHLDAHPDLYDDFEGDRYSHACPFARVMEEGLADRLVQIGIRAANAHQREQARRFGVEMIEMKDWRDGRPLELVGPVYISFDLDALEPALVPGIAHREPGGFTVRQALAVIQSVPGLVGADLVEFNPANDIGGITAAVCAKLVRELAGRMLVDNP
ncbi:MAG TPA: agmatinase [Gemmatimonadales bacterium]|nr:agmatinase [Gemmatimonadales bacterium]